MCIKFQYTLLSPKLISMTFSFEDEYEEKNLYGLYLLITNNLRYLALDAINNNYYKATISVSTASTNSTSS